MFTQFRPHVVILDEPTNHLDMEAIAALSEALKNFAGGVLVISHDQYFIKAVCNEIWVIQDKRIQIFNGSFDDYKKNALKNISA
jgi:ATPase subunit of ABC transporter with duplicated ATPase domains